MSEQNAAAVRQVIERGFSQGDLSVADEVMADEFSEHEYLAPQGLPGPDTLKAMITQARQEMNGLTVTIEDMAVDGDKVWARSVARGRDPRSGRDVSIAVIDICRFSQGRMVEHWGAPDRFALLHQLGALPKPPS